MKTRNLISHSSLHHSRLVVMIAVAAQLACGSGGSTSGPGHPPPPPPQTTIEKGWAAFEARDYSLASAYFSLAIYGNEDLGEAYNGLAWTKMRPEVGASSDYVVALFDSSITYQPYHPADPLAGKAAILWKNELNASADAAWVALELDQRYVLAHDSTYDWHDLRLILAQDYYFQRQFEWANAEIDSLQGNPADPSSPTFVEDILAEITRLTSIYAGK